MATAEVESKAFSYLYEEDPEDDDELYGVACNSAGEGRGNLF